jgi:hypothetical protein
MGIRAIRGRRRWLALHTTLEVCVDPIAGRVICIEGPVGMGWRRWRESEEHYTRRNIRLLLGGLVDAGVCRVDVPVEAMAQLVTGMITHAGIELAETPPRTRKDVRRKLELALHQLLGGYADPIDLTGRGGGAYPGERQLAYGAKDG